MNQTRFKCWTCSTANAFLTHTWWDCQYAYDFWKHTLQQIILMLGAELRLSLMFVVVNWLEDDVSAEQKSLVKILFITARVVWARKWNDSMFHLNREMGFEVS